MKTFKFFWTTHKWTGIILALLLGTTAVTGLLLLVKKRFDWIQPPTLTGTVGEPDDFIPMGALFEIVLQQEHPDFQTAEDIDRIDVRPDRQLYKVIAARNHSEMQVDAVSGEVLSVATRRSDLLENIHDGSFFAGWVHDWVMPVAPLALLLLIGSGLWLWIEPIVRRRRRRASRRTVS